MSWVYITAEQGKAIDDICEKYRTDPAYRDSDCPDCPIRDACRMELPGGTSREDIEARGRMFEAAMAKAAAEAGGQANG